MSAKSIVYVDMDDTLCDYTGRVRAVKERHPDMKFPQSVLGFFEELPPLAGALEAVKELSQQFDVYILSAPTTRNPHCYTEKRVWVENHLDYSWTKKLILSPHKGLLRGDFLIDDHASGRGQEHFQGMLLHLGSPKYPDWPAVLAFFDAHHKS